ncbi:hypothetical protein BU17DRAFT_80078 [Hysterangium stoloniferum]|nr:hypothetical protein BU17DRAFT_80078 [Hysterangium stoloniferum]
MTTAHPAPRVILYRYDGSPFSNKIENILLLKRITFFTVDVSRVLPRPELSDLLGVSYRRIPILAIGNDVYCDTTIIAAALERRFPPGDGYGTIFPPLKHASTSVDKGLQKAFATFYCDRVLFSLSTGSLPWDALPQSFLDDRRALIGTSIDVQANTSRRPIVHSSLSSHLDFFEEQLSDGREWLFNTVAPGLSDISLHFILAWIQPFPGISDVFDKTKFPKTLSWLDRCEETIKQKRMVGPAPEKLTGQIAAQQIISAKWEDLSEIGFDAIEGSRLSVKPGSVISVIPDDYGRSHPTEGRLIGLNREEIVVETKGSLGGVVKVHFPRLGFLILQTQGRL